MIELLSLDAVQDWQMVSDNLQPGDPTELKAAQAQLLPERARPRAKNKLAKEVLEALQERLKLSAGRRRGSTQVSKLNSNELFSWWHATPDGEHAVFVKLSVVPFYRVYFEPLLWTISGRGSG